MVCKEAGCIGPPDGLQGCRPAAPSTPRPGSPGGRTQKRGQPSGPRWDDSGERAFASQGPPRPLALTTPDNLPPNKLPRRGNWVSRPFQTKTFPTPKEMAEQRPRGGSESAWSPSVCQRVGLRSVEPAGAVAPLRAWAPHPTPDAAGQSLTCAGHLGPEPWPGGQLSCLVPCSVHYCVRMCPVPTRGLAHSRNTGRRRGVGGGGRGRVGRGSELHLCHDCDSGAARAAQYGCRGCCSDAPSPPAVGTHLPLLPGDRGPPGLCVPLGFPDLLPPTGGPLHTPQLRKTGTFHSHLHPPCVLRHPLRPGPGGQLGRRALQAPPCDRQPGPSLGHRPGAPCTIPL